MKIAVIINGYPGAGKDTFVEFCKEHYPNTGNVHTSAPAKTAAKVLGWDGEKRPEDRAFLANLVNTSYDLYDGPTKFICKYMEHSGAPVNFIHCREPERIDHIKRTLQDRGYKVITLIIQRSVPLDFSNTADADVWRYHYDRYCDNNGSLYNLKWNAGRFMDELIQGGI